MPTLRMKPGRRVRTAAEDIEAMQIICNLQTMMQVAYGERPNYSKFNGNTVAELRDMQDKLIPGYNAKIREAAL